MNYDKTFNIKKADVKEVTCYEWVCPGCGSGNREDCNPTVNPDFGCDFCGCTIYVEDFDDE